MFARSYEIIYFSLSHTHNQLINMQALKKKRRKKTEEGWVRGGGDFEQLNTPKENKGLEFKGDKPRNSVRMKAVSLCG